MNHNETTPFHEAVETQVIGGTIIHDLQWLGLGVSFND